MTNAEPLDLYSDYLLSAFGQTNATGLSIMLEGQVSHDQIQRFLASSKRTSADLWRIAKPHVRRIEARLRNKRPPQKAPATAPTVLTEMQALALILKEKLGNEPIPLGPSSTLQKRRTSSWKNFKHGKALYHHKG